MRTQKEIVNKIKNEASNIFGFFSEVAVYYLSYKNAKEFLEDEITKEKWDSQRKKYTKLNVLTEAKTYMAEFGWPKARDHRGLGPGLLEMMT